MSEKRMEKRLRIWFYMDTSALTGTLKASRTFEFPCGSSECRMGDAFTSHAINYINPAV